jgi:hypothetical protein
MKTADLEEFLVLVEGENVGATDNRHRIIGAIGGVMLPEKFHVIIYENRPLKSIAHAAFKQQFFDFRRFRRYYVQYPGITKRLRFIFLF